MAPIPEDIERFLDGNIESFDQLEVLRVLGDNPGREWDLGELARQTQTEPKALAPHLAALHARGLLSSEARPAGPVYRYGPHTEELEAMVCRLLQMYRERPVTLIKMTYARTNAGLRAFAEAFRLRKEG